VSALFSDVYRASSASDCCEQTWKAPTGSRAARDRLIHCLSIEKSLGERFCVKFFRNSALCCLLLILVSLVWAQTPGSSDQSSPSKTPNGETAQAAPEQEQKISPKEADELFRSVDEILQFASKDTDLPIKHEVKRRLVSRDEVEAYLKKSMAEDKSAKRLQRTELVLKKFGLLPRDFDLQTFLVALLREQVAGYYDAKTKTVNLLDWIDAEQQKPVLAHELTHALQDQSFGLEKWMKIDDVDLDEKKNVTAEDIENDEAGEAREAVVEGQAMAVLVDYMLVPTGQSLLTAPQVADALTEGMLEGTSDSPQFQKAPIFLREELTFPYRYGLDFEAALLKIGKQQAFAGTFANPPHTTRQIMQPETYVSGEKIPPMPLPDFKHDFKDYERFDVGAMGEFDVDILIDQYANAEISKDLYPHWRGGYYYAARPKGDPSAPLAILYVSRWSSPEAAAQFAAIYAKALAKRYKQVREAADEKNPIADLQTIASLNGTHTWVTEEGRVVIVVQGNTVFITESLDPPTSEHLQQEVLGAASASHP
jgi:hypothetical protein